MKWREREDMLKAFCRGRDGKKSILHDSKDFLFLKTHGAQPDEDTIKGNSGLYILVILYFWASFLSVYL